MKVLITLSILVAYASAASLAHLKAADNVLCEKPICHVNETKHWPHRDPTKFWKCQPGTIGNCEDDTWEAVVMECPAPLYFSYKHQVCVWCDDWVDVCGDTPTVTPPTSTTEGGGTVETEEPGDCEKPICHVNETTHWPHINPFKFWKCKPGTIGNCEEGSWEAVEMDCPAPLYFSWDKQVCVWCDDWDNVCGVVTPTRPPPTTEPPSTIEDTETPPPGDCEKPICHVNETTHWPHKDPTKFWKCAPGTIGNCEEGSWEAVEMECPAPLYFSWAKQVCVWCDDWDNVCGVATPTKPPPTTPTTEAQSTAEDTETPPPGDCEKPICHVNETTHWPHKDPTKFWKCAPGTIGNCEDDTWEAVEMECPAPLYFSWAKQVCVWCHDWDNVCGVPSPTPPKPTPTTPTTTTDGGGTVETEEPGDCEKPICHVNETTHWPHINPFKFWKCAPGTIGNCEEGTWEAVEMNCPSPLYFSYAEQVCVWCDDWDNVCGVDPPKPTPPPTTSTTEDGSGAELPEIVDCDNPVCVANETIHWPHRDPTKFWQCAPDTSENCEEGSWKPVPMPCPKGLIFHYWIQVCDWPCEEWQDPCLH